MPNKMKRSVKSTNPFKDSISMPGDAGVFGANPAPGFRDYPQSKGKTLPPTKQAETDFGKSAMKENKLSRNVQTPSIPERMGLQMPGSTKIITGRNRYNTNVKSSNTLDKRK